MTEDLPLDSANWVSPYTLPPLPNLQRSRGQSSHLKSPDLPRPYYAAAWGSPYATPSPRRPARPALSTGQHAALGSSSPSLPTRQLLQSPSIHEVSGRPVPLRTQTQPVETHRNRRTEHLNWLSDSEDTGSETAGKEQEDQTPTREAFLDSWGPSPESGPAELPRIHRRSESLATITPDIFHGAEIHSIEPHSPQQLLFPSLDFKMASPDSTNVDSGGKTQQALDRRRSLIEAEDKPLPSPTSPLRPRPSSLQSYQRPKKKIMWRGKTCIIALPLTDREAAGLPPLLTAEEIKNRLTAWVSEGYKIDGFELTHSSSSNSVQSSGQSRPVYPDPQDVQTERKLRSYQVSIPNQAEWESWVSYLKEEKLRALGVSPSNSEAPPSTRSPFSPDLSRVSSGYPGLVPSPPVAPSSSASNPLRATSNPFSPSLISSTGMSPQLGSVNSSHFGGIPKPMHAHKQSMAPPNQRGRINSPFDHAPSQSHSFSPGVPMLTSIPPLSSRQNSFSPNNPLRLPNLGEVLSPNSQQPGFDPRGPNPNMPPAYSRHGYFPSQANFTGPYPGNWKAPSPALPQRVDSLTRTPEFRVPSRSPIEIAHPTPKSHRHNLSMALQREIDEAEASLVEKDRNHGAQVDEDIEQPMRKDSNFDEQNDEPPIIRRPETLTDERSEIETNPSIAATPMLMDDKNPFVTWQALSDAAKGDTKVSETDEPPAVPPKFNVQAKEFDPRGDFSSSNFSFNNNAFAPFGSSQQPSTSAPVVPKNAAKNRLSLSHLNADAPAFTPTFASSLTPKDLSFEPLTEDLAIPKSSAAAEPVQQKAPKDSGFKFSSATFNVDAPVFSPSNSIFSNIGSNIVSTTPGSTVESNSIFGNIVIGPDSKPTRRGSKAVTITRPKSKEGPIQDDLSSSGEEKYSDDQEDEGGRPMAPVDRQKRARRTGSDRDISPVYADSAPFRQTSTTPAGTDVLNTVHSYPIEPRSSFDGWSYISPDENELKDKPLSTGQKSPTHHSRGSASSFTFKNEGDAAMFNDARPPWDKHVSGEPKGATKQELPLNDHEVTDEVARQPSPPQPVVRSHKVKSSLSALAKPFEFSPKVSSPNVASSFSTPRKPQGLEASRFAAPADSQETPVALGANLSSPPPNLDHYLEPGSQSEVEVEVETPSDAEAKALSISSAPSLPDQDVESLAREASIHSDPEAEAPANEDDLIPGLRMRPQDEPVPSFEEIDAVMKQFEVHPELGIERIDTPLQSTPLVDMRLSGIFRSDAPSPSPARLHDDRILHGEVSYPPSTGLGIGIHKLNAGREDVSDWGGSMPAAEEAKLQLRSQFFDGHVNDLVDGILENRLGPLESTLQTIQNSLAVLAGGSKTKHERKPIEADIKDSDADDEDEDDYDAFEGFASYRSKSPIARREVWKQDRIRAAVSQALASYEPPAPAQPALDLTEFSEMLQEIRQVALQNNSLNTQHELRTVVEDVISQHPRLRGSRVQQDHEAAEGKLRPQIDGLESMLKIAKEHNAEEVQLRRKAEEQVAELKLRLRIAEEEAAQYREASEETQQTLVAFLEEKESYKSLEEQFENMTLQNSALQTTLDEYRVSSDQWRDDIREERSKNKALRETLHDLAKQLEEQSQSRTLFRNRVERLQEDLTRVVQDTQSEQADSREREHKLLSNIALVEDALSQERRHRSKAEADLDALEKGNRANLHYKRGLEDAEKDISRLNDLVASLREENRALDTKSFELTRELDHVQKSKDAEVGMSTARLQAELESTKGQLHSIRTDTDAQISRLQSRLDHAELDLEDQKAKHDALLSETIEAHKEAIRESNERRESSLEDQHQAHEKKLNDLRERHTRELHNSFDNRTRLEHQLNERLSLGEDKNKHLQSRIADLEDRLDVAKSALRAAAEAALAKGVNLPTPAPSVVASPPQRATSASISYSKVTDLPEKISPQALRESIMVLQDQLQNREMKIEQLEAELAAVDKEAPNKIKERDTEIGWLRELLSVRADDLEDLITTLAQPDFNRDTVKDAAIRLRANLQMEQQLKERAHSGLVSSLPSISSLTSYAQSPKALPMAAVAALSNWRKARDTSIGAISDFATGIGSQTPSRSTVGSPASILSGIMTPPSTNQRQSLSGERSAPPPSMRPLAAAAQARKGAAEARPLRAYNSQPRALSSRQQEKRPEDSQPFPPLRDESPHTPTQSKRPSLDFADDVDEDASPLDGRHTKHLEEAEPVSG